MPRTLAPLFALTLLTLLLLAACGTTDDNDTIATPTLNDAPATPTRNDAPADNESLSTVDIAQLLRPAVVHILADGAGVGTGIIIDEDGHIVTNNHVITTPTGQPSPRITVTLEDDSEYIADVVGGDPPTDLAVLRIDAPDLQPVSLGRSGDLLVGEEVVAMGNALNLPGGPTVTTGVVSAVNRFIQEGNVSLQDAIQTDAAINRGNSGGPLVNMRGEVIGITTAVIRGDAAEGIGLAISIDSARPIIEELMEEGEVGRGYLGVIIAPARFAPAEGCPRGNDDEGVVILDIEPGAPADDAGLSRCDILVRLEGFDITTTNDLFQALTEHREGETVEIEFHRQGRSETTEITLG